MKKLFNCCMIFILSFVFVGCNCEHEYDKGKVKKAATCTEEGINTFICVKCSEEINESIPLTEHTYDSGKVVKESTCAEEGEKVLTCKVCGNEKIESINKTEHEYEETITKEATFTEKGIKSFTCKNCGNSYTEAIPIKDDKVIFTVENKINYEKNAKAWRFSPFVEFVCKIENMTNKDIKGVEGELIISDLFGKKIGSTECDITGEDIPANGYITKNGWGIEINEFMDTDMKIYNTNYDDLKFEYKVKQIIYTDGTIETS